MRKICILGALSAAVLAGLCHLALAVESYPYTFGDVAATEFAVNYADTFGMTVKNFYARTSAADVDFEGFLNGRKVWPDYGGAYRVFAGADGFFVGLSEFDSVHGTASGTTLLYTEVWK